MNQQERSISDSTVPLSVAGVSGINVRPNTSRELFDSLLLFGLAATSLGAYVGIAFFAVRMLGTR